MNSGRLMAVTAISVQRAHRLSHHTKESTEIIKVTDSGHAGASCPRPAAAVRLGIMIGVTTTVLGGLAVFWLTSASH
jgi:hypothetical protein